MNALKEKTAKNTDHTPQEEKNFNTTQLIVFKLGSEEFGLGIGQIKEIVLTPHITKMPRTPDYIKGVANIRGNVIAIIDLERKFGIAPGQEEKEGSAGQYTLVIESDEVKIGILVREVPNTLAIAQNNIEEVNNITGESDPSNYIEGVVKLDGRMIILIDIFKVINTGGEEL